MRWLPLLTMTLAGCSGSVSSQHAENTQPVLLGGHTSAPIPVRTDVTARITKDVLVLPANQAAPYLSEHGWIIGGKRSIDPKGGLLDWARRQKLCEGGCNERAFMYVSLGPKPTFGAFIRTAQSLRQVGLCHSVFVKEGGKVGGNVVSALDNEMLGFNVC